MYLCPSFTPEPPDQSPPNCVQTSTPTQETHVWPYPLTPGYPKLQNLSRSGEKKLCFTNNALNFSRAAPGHGWIFMHKISSHYFISGSCCQVVMTLGSLQTDFRIHSRVIFWTKCKKMITKLSYSLMFSKCLCSDRLRKKIPKTDLNKRCRRATPTEWSKYATATVMM